MFALHTASADNPPEPPVACGLTTVEAQARLAQFGPNATPDGQSSVWRRALAKFWAPVPWMLEAAVLFEVVLGDYPQATVIAVLLSFNAVLATGVVFAFVLDALRIATFHRLQMA
jgi:H+-transporting ATPase